MSHVGTTFVLGSQSVADALAKGEEPVLRITKVGYGDRREKVVFEANKGGNLETWLMSEVAKRHAR